MALTEVQRSQLIELARTEGYKFWKGYFDSQIQSKLNGFVSESFQDLSEVASLQEEIRTIRKVFNFVEQLKGE